MAAPSWSFHNGTIYDPGNNWSYDLSQHTNNAQNLDQAMQLARQDWQSKFDPTKLVLSNDLTAAGQGIQQQAKDWGNSQTWNANPFLSRPDLAPSTPGGGGTGAAAPLNPWGQPQGTPRPANALAAAAGPYGNTPSDPFREGTLGPSLTNSPPGTPQTIGGGGMPATDPFASRRAGPTSVPTTSPWPMPQPNLPVGQGYGPGGTTPIAPGFGTPNVGLPPGAPPNLPPGGSGGGQPINPLQNPPYWSSNNDPRMYVLNPNASGPSITIGSHVYAPTDPRPYYDPKTGYTLFMNPQTGVWTDGSGKIVQDPRGGGQPPTNLPIGQGYGPGGTTPIAPGFGTPNVGLPPGGQYPGQPPQIPPSRGDYMGYGPNAGGLRVDPNYLPENWNYQESPEYLWRQQQAEKGLNRNLLALGRSNSTGGINALANLRSNIAADEVNKQYQRALAANQENYGRYFNANLTNYGRTQGEDVTGYNRALTQDELNWQRQAYLGNQDWNQNYQLADLGLRATTTGVGAGNATGQSLATLLSQNGANQASLALQKGQVTADQLQSLLNAGWTYARINTLFNQGGTNNALAGAAGYINPANPGVGVGYGGGPVGVGYGQYQF